MSQNQALNVNAKVLTPNRKPPTPLSVDDTENRSPELLRSAPKHQVTTRRSASAPNKPVKILTPKVYCL